MSGNHLAVSHKGKAVKVYDSVYASSVYGPESAATVKTLFNCTLCNISMVPVKKQLGESDCGFFAIANATAIAFGRDPSKEAHQQSLMRNHVIPCFEQKKMVLFP